MLKFRMGAAKLPINDHTRARQDRTCRCGQRGALGNERHQLLECPAMQPVGQRFAPFIRSSRYHADVFMWQKDLFSVACYICACIKLHASLLED